MLYASLWLSLVVDGAPVPLIGDARAVSEEKLLPEAPPGEYRKVKVGLVIYTEPATSSPRRGVAHRGEVVEVQDRVPGRVPGRGCTKEGWGRLEGEGYACLDGTTPTTDPPYPLPRLTRFDHPSPAEFETYLKTGKWERAASDDTAPLVPFIYGKRWRRWQGVFYDGARVFEKNGEISEDQLDPKQKFHFTSVKDTRRGEVLVRSDGKVIPSSGIFLYSVSDFHGRDLGLDPLPPGKTVAWVHGYKGAPLLSGPTADAPVVQTLEYHARFDVDATPVDPEGHIFRVPDALGPGQDGWVDERKGVRRWISWPRPPEIEPGSLWVDIDVSQQMLTLWEGDEPVFITLVSTGKPGHGTPQGIFRLGDKMSWVDMASRDDAEEAEKYLVEAVPWTMHFGYRYALHAAYWHWGYGNWASHGCVNLSPRDARMLFERLHPALPDGWHTVYENADDPGSSVRIHWADIPIQDRRKPLGAKWSSADED
jgi:hypothetical protein